MLRECKKIAVGNRTKERDPQPIYLSLSLCDRRPLESTRPHYPIFTYFALRCVLCKLVFVFGKAPAKLVQLTQEIARRGDPGWFCRHEPSHEPPTIGRRARQFSMSEPPMSSPKRSPLRRPRRMDAPAESPRTPRECRDGRDEPPRTPREERSDGREKRQCAVNLRGDDAEVNMPLGTPKHPAHSLTDDIMRAPSPKAKLFAVAESDPLSDLEETLPPPMISQDSLQMWFTSFAGASPQGQGVLRKVSEDSLLRELRSEPPESTTKEVKDPKKKEKEAITATPHAVCHLADWHLESSEFAQRLGLSQRSSAATGHVLSDARPLSRATSLPASVLSINGRSSRVSYGGGSFSSGHRSARLETPPCGDRAFEAHAALVACPAPQRISRPQRAAMSLRGRAYTTLSASSSSPSFTL